MALGLGCMVMASVCAFALLNARGFAGFASYTTLDLANRTTMNQFTKDIRMTQALTNFSSSAVSLVDFDGTPLQYTYSPSAQTLVRIKANQTNVLLRDCTQLTFAMLMRNMTNATFDYFPTTNTYECKALSVSWAASRKLLGVTNVDMPQINTVVIRN